LHDSPFFVTKSATYAMEDTDRLPSKPLPPPPPQRLPTPSSSLDSEPLTPTKKKVKRKQIIMWRTNNDAV
jgi:hypothetical protein